MTPTMTNQGGARLILRTMKEAGVGTGEIFMRGSLYTRLPYCDLESSITYAVFKGWITDDGNWVRLTQAGLDENAGRPID
jgi:hypothetical protein